MLRAAQRCCVQCCAVCSAATVDPSWAGDVMTSLAAQSSFAYLPIVSNPENTPCIQMVIWITTKISSFVRWPVANLPWKFHANPFRSFFVQRC